MKFFGTKVDLVGVGCELRTLDLRRLHDRILNVPVERALLET